MYKYTRRPDATAAGDKDNGSGDNVGVRGMSEWSCVRGVKREIGKHSSDVFQDGRRRPLDPPHTLCSGVDETSARVSRSDSPSNNDLLRNATATAASLLSSFCLCLCVCVCVCVRVNLVRFTYTACASHAVQKHRPPPPSSFRRPVHTANSLGRIYRYTRTPTSRKEIPTVRQRAI